jgi:hypothetical protein
MKSPLRYAVAAALGLAFIAGRASSRPAATEEHAAASCPQAAEATAASLPDPRPWTVQGYRGDDCQVLGDVPECD